MDSMRDAGVRDARKDNLKGDYTPGKGLEGHHKNPVSKNPEQASDPRNIEFMDKPTHIEHHRNNPQ